MRRFELRAYDFDALYCDVIAGAPYPASHTKSTTRRNFLEYAATTTSLYKLLFSITALPNWRESQGKNAQEGTVQLLLLMNSNGGCRTDLQLPVAFVSSR